MLKWGILIIVSSIVLIFVVKIIKVMLKTEKESNAPKPKEDIVNEEYNPNEVAIDIHSSNASVLTDMSTKPEQHNEVESNIFNDSLDDEFEDYRQFAKHNKGRRRMPKDFDIDGEYADEYIPSSPEFSFLNPSKPRKAKKSIETELNDLSTELKVLMLSDIFDRKF